MFFSRNLHAAFLLLVLTQRLGLASIGDKRNKVGATIRVSEVIIRSMQVLWIERTDSTILTSENSPDEEVTVIPEPINVGQTWPLQMLNVSSKIQSGILEKNRQDFGTYNQCLAINKVYDGTNVQGKLCTIWFGSLLSAICVPSSCNETDIAGIVDAAIQNVTGINDLQLRLDGVTCVPLGSEAFTLTEVITIIFFTLVIGFSIFGTICEFTKKYKTTGVSPVVDGLAEFSLYTNAMSLLSTHVSPRMMPAIHGIRFFSTCWIALGHCYLNTLFMPLVDSSVISLEWYDPWNAVYIQAAPFAVDTFFVVSGFLMTHQFFELKKSGQRSNNLMMYIYRYCRLTLGIVVLMLFLAVLLHRFGNGPLWESFLFLYGEPCRKNWWVNLLYIQNFVRADEICLPHSWFLAVDMQLFWISPFILYPLYRWPKWGLGILSLFLVGSVITPATILAVNSYSNAVVRSNVPAREIMVSFHKYYIPTHNRACAYFVGILLGYDATNNRRHLGQVNVAINWAVASVLFLLCGLATQRAYDNSFDYDGLLEIMLAILLRPFWSIAIAWIVYACAFGYGGVVTRFLSLPIFLPLSRLTYSIYLVHTVVQGVKVSSAQAPGRFSDFLMLDYFWGDLPLSIVVAFFFSLFYESPVIVLENILTNCGRQRSSMQETKTDVEDGIDSKAMMESSLINS